MASGKPGRAVSSIMMLVDVHSHIASFAIDSVCRVSRSAATSTA
jgi:hypothetical protein